MFTTRYVLTARWIEWLLVHAFVRSLHHHHHGLHHLNLTELLSSHGSSWNFARHCYPSFWVFVSTALPGAIDSKFAVNFWMKINTLITVCASWKVLAGFSGMNIRTFFRFLIAIWEVLAFYLLFCITRYWSWCLVMRNIFFKNYHFLIIKFLFYNGNICLRLWHLRAFGLVVEALHTSLDSIFSTHQALNIRTR